MRSDEIGWRWLAAQSSLAAEVRPTLTCVKASFQATGYRSVITARPVVSIGDENAICAFRPTQTGKTAVCDRCKAIDIEVNTFRHLRADEALAQVLIAEVISDLESEKASLIVGHGPLIKQHNR